jgi:HD superfamily phosphohydrolase
VAILEKKWWGFIKDPVFGYIHLTEDEKNIIDTKSFQRLGRIKQLAGAEYVYPAANHTRFEHALGVMHLSGELSKNLDNYISKEEKYELRLAGLLHDIGHGPFSHVFETLLNKFFKKNHEDMTRELVKHGEIKEALEKTGYDPKKISGLATGSLKGNKPYLNQILRGTVDVDKMDYIVRDSYHTGAGYSADVWRLIYTMDIVNNNLSVNSTAIYTLEAFLMARVESFKSIYFHKTARAAQIMLSKAMINAYQEEPFFNPNNLDEYINLDDYTLWSIMKINKASANIIDDLEHRKLLKSVYENVLITKEEVFTNIFTKPQIRTQIESEIADQAKVSVDDVIIDVPLVPSVPYSYSSGEERFEVPLFDKKSKTLETRSISSVSKIIDALKGYLNIVRVYTTIENRKRVQESARKVLGNIPYELKLAT